MKNWKKVIGWGIAIGIVVFAIYTNIQKQQIRNEKPNILFMEYQTGLGTASDAMKKLLQPLKKIIRLLPSIGFQWIQDIILPPQFQFCNSNWHCVKLIWSYHLAF